MTVPITAATRLIALLGDPVSHSLSPVFQNAALRAAGLDAAYLAIRCDGAAVSSLMAAVARAGGAGNVTVPHKELAAAAIDRPNEAVIRTGACNTFWPEGGVIHGDNTDVAGFRRASEGLLGRSLAGARALVLGAGGAARAAVWALLQAGADSVVIVNRSRDRAEELVDRFSSGGRIEASDAARLRGESFDLVVNATSLGLRPDDPFPLPEDSPIRFDAALDLVYAPGRTPWVNALRDRGITADDGLEMLVQQGAEAFERWFGVPAPLLAMRSALPPR